MLVLSCQPRKGLCASVITLDSFIEKVDVKSLVLDDSSNNTFFSLIRSFTLGLDLLRLYIEEHSDVSEVVIECNNATFVSWVAQGYSKPMYSRDFQNFMSSLNLIPVRYTFVYKKVVLANRFADKKYIRAFKVTKFDI